MKKLIYLFVFIFSFSVLSAQEKLTKEEKARREKNIQAGNPFAQFGYKAKIATLSKGKYLEFHDLDSIVTIGTIRWHVEKNQIVGRIVQDSLNPDAQPIGDRVGRWISPDPLSEEFPSWSPYTMCYDNPIKNVDPDGRAADDWKNANGDLVYDTSKNGGKGGYTEFATAQDREYGNALRSSGETGQKLFNYLVSPSTQDIQINFLSTDASSEGLGYYFGQTTNKYTKSADGTIVTGITSSEINIFTGTSETFVKDIKNNTLMPNIDTTDKQKEDISIIKNNNLTAKNVTTATLAHELEHTTKGNQQATLNKERNSASTSNNEYRPQITNNQVLKDLAKKNN